jgi:DNA-binding SARP family transcriptional activator
MNAQLKLFLLGPFRVERAGQPLTDFKSNKVRALLAYLAVERDTPQHRDVLAGLLWPESANALAMLRDALSNLRRVLDDRDAESPIIRVVADTLQLDPAQLWLDVAELDALTTGASRAALEATLARAAALYRGDFLDGFTLADTPDFEMWVLLQRETLRRAVQDALYRLATLCLQRGDYAAARTWVQRQLALNRYREAAHRQLLRALALDGQRNRALAHYAEYCALLDEELGVTPDVRTTALYQRIRAGSLRPDTAFAPLPPPGAPRSPEGDAHPSPFVGRAAELQRLATALQRARQGEGQVLFVTGEAGSGKTMLVQTFAHRILARADDVVVARGACNAQIGTGDPYLPFREILRLLTGDFDVPAIGDVLTLAYEQQLETFIPTTLQALREQGVDLIDRLVSLHPESGATSGAQRAGNAPAGSKRPSPSLGRSLSAAALCDQVTRVLRAVARQCVLLLVLDDLQWADSGTLNLLTHLGRRLAGSRILLVGIYRPAETGPDHPLLPIVHELQQMHGDVVVDLDQAGGQDFVDAFLDSMPNLFASVFRAQLARQTGGHALFTAALIQQMQEEGTLVQDTEGRWRAGVDLDWSQLPPRVEAVIAKRLARLSPKHQELALLKKGR